VTQGTVAQSAEPTRATNFGGAPSCGLKTAQSAGSSASKVVHAPMKLPWPTKSEFCPAGTGAFMMELVSRQRLGSS